MKNGNSVHGCKRLLRVKDSLTGKYFWIINPGGSEYLMTYPKPLNTTSYYPSNYCSFKVLPPTPFLPKSKIPHKTLTTFLRKKILREWLGYFPEERSRLFWKIITSPLKAMVVKFPPRIGSESKLLDVGCGSGKYLRNLQELGWAVSGVELNQSVVQKLKKEGLEIHGGVKKWSFLRQNIM